MKLILLIIFWIWTIVSLGLIFPWYIPFVFFVVSGFLLVTLIDGQGDYDFFTPMLQFGLIIAIIASSVSFLIGKFLF